MQVDKSLNALTGSDGEETDTSLASDYQRIERVILHLREHALSQPTLADAARAAHLSESHLQRLFTRWAGISPKRFLQHLTLACAGRSLREHGDLLAACDEAGLSGPGRLHDLFVTLQAVTPGEFKTGGAGLQISWGMVASPFGQCFIAFTARGICSLEFDDFQDPGPHVTRLRRNWPAAHITEITSGALELSQRIFAALEGKSPSKALSVLVTGTNFQHQVWKALLDIPCGATRTYKEIASAIGHPSATRAVGNAVGANPIAFLIPCHRVLRTDGGLGGYRWGVQRKVACLAWETL